MTKHLVGGGILLAFAGMSGFGALAQSPGLSDPTDPAAPVPTSEYRSAFSGYQAYDDVKPMPWREAVDRVARQDGSGGQPHALHTGATQQADPGGQRHAGHASDKPQDGTGGRRHAEHAYKQAALASGRSNSKIHVQTATEKPRAGPPVEVVMGSGVVREIDRAGRRVKIAHDPIAALGWPAITLFFRLKDGVPVDQITEGDKVAFSLEQSASGYVIGGFSDPRSSKRPMAGHHASLSVDR